MRNVRSLIQNMYFNKGTIYTEIVPTDDKAYPGELWVLGEGGEEFFFWYHPDGHVNGTPNECEVVE